ncbi:MAG: adenylate/guanylate cyclase domain-containing protein, partial [Planctomycetales bacterium]|nr:adenylate/guanylate cyclase domain-containing protein [Planctomycetales bacterium]
ADISELEMLFVELIASGISSGLIRVEHERRSSAARTRFEQFFPPSLAKRLEDDESFLKGRNCDVSILFCDIRRFSEISERIGPEETVLWINSVMDALSECVLQHNGVLVDYIGDELFAMWGAPDEQPNHAVLACRAALSMLDKLPRLNELWSERIGGPLDIGIGINSGQAQVGNIGSNVKFKYGPLGNSVNIASRIQNATKQLQATALVSEATARLVADKMMLRRLCQIQVVNVQTPITVYELAADQSEEYGELSRLYQAGLAAFESGNSIEACKKLTEVLARYPDDGPSIILLSRAVNQIGHPDAAVDTVWRLDRK